MLQNAGRQAVIRRHDEKTKDDLGRFPFRIGRHHAHGRAIPIVGELHDPWRMLDGQLDPVSDPGYVLETRGSKAAPVVISRNETGLLIEPFDVAPPTSPQPELTLFVTYTLPWVGWTIGKASPSQPAYTDRWTWGTFSS